MTQNILIVLQGLFVMAWPFVLTSAFVLGGLYGYRALVAKLDRSVALRAEQAAARSRVARRRNAAARNLEWLASR